MGNTLLFNILLFSVLLSSILFSRLRYTVVCTFVLGLGLFCGTRVFPFSSEEIFFGTKLSQRASQPLILELREDRPFPNELLTPEVVDEEYVLEEGRRFDITFFLALPFFLFYQVILNQILASNVTIRGSGSNNQISEQQWIFIAVSSGLLAGGVSYSDWVSVFGKDSKTAMNLGWSFSF